MFVYNYLRGQNIPAVELHANELLSKLTSGNYNGYYDIHQHNSRFIFTGWDNPVDRNDIPYLRPDANGQTLLTYRDGSTIPLEEGDWLVPILIRKEAGPDVHLLLPNTLLQDRNAGDTLYLIYNRKQEFAITLGDLDPQFKGTRFDHSTRFQAALRETEQQLYGQEPCRFQPYVAPSVKRLAERAYLPLGCVALWIEQMNHSNNRFIFSKENKKFERCEGQEEVVDLNLEEFKDNNGDIDKTRVRVISTLSADPIMDAPWMRRNHIGCYLYTTADKIVMAVQNGELIIWQHNEPKSIVISSDEECDMCVPIDVSRIPARNLIPNQEIFPGIFPSTTDTFTYIPLNEETITEEEFLANLDKIEFPHGVMFNMKL